MHGGLHVDGLTVGHAAHDLHRATFEPLELVRIADPVQRHVEVDGCGHERRDDDEPACQGNGSCPQLYPSSSSGALRVRSLRHDRYANRPQAAVMQPRTIRRLCA